jgi:hypothetical protein
VLSATRSAALTILIAASGLSALALERLEQGEGGFGRERRRVSPLGYDATTAYDGRFSFVRIRYGAASQLAQGRFFRGEPPWAHDFPRAEFNFTKIVNELTFLRSVPEQGNILMLDDPALGQFPIAYMSEPGFWQPNQAEVEALRSYLQKGGFIIFDDFRGYHVNNLFAQMRRVMPAASFRKLDASHPIFHSFFEINTLDPRSGYYADEGDTEWLGMFEDNDPRKRLIAIANNNHDLGELWEFSDTGYVPVDLSNEAYKFGVNYVMYAMTH